MKATSVSLLFAVSACLSLGASQIAGAQVKAKKPVKGNAARPAEIEQLGVIPVGIVINNNTTATTVPINTDLSAVVTRANENLIATDCILSAYVVPPPTKQGGRLLRGNPEHRNFKAPKFAANGRDSGPEVLDRLKPGDVGGRLIVTAVGFKGSNYNSPRPKVVTWLIVQ